jgi:hypothetical protein
MSASTAYILGVATPLAIGFLIAAHAAWLERRKK